jgi:hypothetical protein
MTSLSEQRFYLYVYFDKQHKIKNYLIRYDYDVVPVLTTNINDATLFVTHNADQLIGLKRENGYYRYENNIITMNPLCNTSKFEKEFPDLSGGKRKKRTRRRRKKGTRKRRRN